MHTLEEASLASKVVLVRIDADVPLSNGPDGLVVANDFRLQRLLPTLFYLINHRAKIILVGHAGRPHGKFTPELSLKPVFTHLSALVNRKILFSPDPFSSKTAEIISQLNEGDILAIENLRFLKGEEDGSRTLARRLAGLADIYVNEAFGTAHRDAASVTAITEFLPSYAGLQFEREIEMLSSLTKHPAHPFIAIIGGAKISDKLPVITSLLNKVDRIIVGGGVANVFLASAGVDVKKSQMEVDFIPVATKMFRRAKGKIIVPSDFVWGDDQILDIGPNSTADTLKYIKSAKTILWSGVPGKIEEPAYVKASTSIARAIAASAATSIVGGGDTTGFIDSLGLTNRFSFVSTGGSATLQLLAAGSLPGVKALN